MNQIRYKIHMEGDIDGARKISKRLSEIIDVNINEYFFTEKHAEEMIALMNKFSSYQENGYVVFMGEDYCPYRIKTKVLPFILEVKLWEKVMMVLMMMCYATLIIMGIIAIMCNYNK